MNDPITYSVAGFTFMGVTISKSKALSKVEMIATCEVVPSQTVSLSFKLVKERQVSNKRATILDHVAQLVNYINNPNTQDISVVEAAHRFLLQNGYNDTEQGVVKETKT